jgi:RNA polymerase sigma-70 factor (ECF subfamily)
VRAPLTGEAIRLARLLAGLMPDEPTVLGLLALLLLHDSRRAARVDPDGSPVLLADQDRTRWDTAAIREGVALVGAALRRTPDRPDRYVVQAAIAACHALAPSYAGTDWDAVISWYDVLLTVQDTPVTRLNRAVAVAERGRPRRRSRPGRRDRRAGRVPVVACHPRRAAEPAGRQRGGARRVPESPGVGD